MKNTKMPTIRFKGFNDDWEQRKLEEVCSEIGDGLHSAPEYDDNGKSFFINGNNLINGHIVINSNETKRVSENTFEKNNKQLDDNTVLLSIIGTIGNLAYYQGEPVMLGKSAAYLKANKIDKTFLYSLLQTTAVMNNFMLSLTGTTIKNLGLDAIKKTKISIPKLREQERIGLYFSQLDHLITLHQRKLEKIKLMKKSMLGKMFSRDAESIPKIRFDGYTDDWEQRKLPEFVTFFNGLTYTPDDVEETGTLVLRSSNVKNGEIVDADNVYVNDKVVTSENVQEGDIIVVVRNGSRALIGKHAQIKASMPNTVIGAFMSGMRSEHSSFVNALLDTSAFENEIAKNMGATINQITGYMFSKMEFMIPSGEEQQKIGEYFQGLDHLITLHQRKLEKLKKVKKSLLEHMFPMEK